MIQIREQLCIGCGLCAQDCFSKCIRIVEGKASFQRPQACILCGHCVSVCPKNAVKLTEDSYLPPQIPLADEASPEALMSLICSRRSIRNFQNRPVPKDVWEALLEAGRYTPTGGNRQRVTYLIVQEDLDAFKALAWDGLERLALQVLANPETYGDSLRHYAPTWKHFCDRHRQQPEKDYLFFNAPALLVVEGDTLSDAAPAASNIGLMAHALGLGTLTSGFLQAVLRFDHAAADFLQIRRKDSCVCNLVGYPNVRYQRIPPRKRADVHWR